MKTIKIKLKQSTLKEIKNMIQFCLENDWIISTKQLDELNKMMSILEKYVDEK